MFKRFINFKTIPQLGRLQIGEPIGSDKSSFKVTQEDGRFGRDLFIADQDTELILSRDFFERMDVPQVTIDGPITDFATLGFDYILDMFETECWEGEVECIIQKDGVDFITGVFNYVTASAQFDQIKINIIQNSNREFVKRLQSTNVDAFSSTALDGRSIPPCQVTPILLKAKPIVQISKWEMAAGVTFNSLNGEKFMPFTNLNTYGIENSLVIFENRKLDFRDSVNNFRYVTAVTDLSNGSIAIDVKATLRYRPNNSSSTNGRFILNAYRHTKPFNNGDPIEIIPIYSKNFSGSANQDFLVEQVFNVQLPDLQTGESLSIFWADQFVSSAALNDMAVVFEKFVIDMKYTSTAIDTVTYGVRLIDLVKHNVKSMADMQVIAPDYDVNGEHYDNFAFNGLLLGQITNKPFYNKFEDLINFVKETCSDYQINRDSVEILKFEDFYKDVEILSIDELGDYSATKDPNKRFAIKTADFKYKKSSQGRETNGENTLDDVHTETQKFITNKVDGNLKVELNAIRSAFSIEDQKRRAFDNDQTTSLENDDSLFLLKCVPLPPGTEGGFTRKLLMQLTDSGNLKILNNDEDSTGVNFNWTILGISVGQAFYIDSGENIGTWNVVSITPSIIELSPVSVPDTFEGEAYIKMRWYFNNVLYTNKTNEGYASITGVDNPESYSNLDYHWARNIERWYPYLATATKFKPDGVIKTASFNVNGELSTRKSTELSPRVDSADIVNSNIANFKVLDPFIYKTKCRLDFDKAIALINDIGSIKGYVSLNTNDGRRIKGHVKDMDYTWMSEELDLTLESRFQGDYMDITPTVVTNPEYPDKNNLASFRITNIYVSLFDNRDVQLYPAKRFSRIKIQGVLYPDIESFSDALQNLIDSMP